MSSELKVSRSDDDLLAALNNHLKLLEEYSHKAFVQQDEKYVGEVAGKLRVLAYRSRTNKPLLLDLMQKHGKVIKLNFDNPGGTESLTIDEYLASLAVAHRLASGDLVKISIMEFIGLWAQQRGAAHEDWEVSEKLERIISAGVTIGNLPIGASALRTISETIFSFGKAFLAELD